MTDQTAARDRLNEWAINGGPYSAANLRSDVTEVLRALAGAPTADVADYDAIPALAKVIEEAHAAYRNTASPWTAIAQNVVEAGFRRGAAPEGVDAADELRKAMLIMTTRRELVTDEQHDRAHAAYSRELARLRFELDEARRERAGMQHLAQRNRRELTAAQAAIQRVRELADHRERAGMKPLAAKIRRAIDGDTTEEQR